jgi:hypothetical protein
VIVERLIEGRVNDQVESAIRAGMDGLAAKRTLPVFG